MTIRRWTLKKALFALCGVGALLLVPLSVGTQMTSATVQAQGASSAVEAQGVNSVEVGQLSPSVPGAESASPEAESAPALRAALAELHLARREARDALVDNSPPSPRGLAQVVGRETVVGGTASSDFRTPPGLNAFVIGRNNLNPRASTVGVGNDLAEPTAVNEGTHVFYNGNTHAEFSINGGMTYTPVPYPAAPAGQFICCDPDSIYDQARGVTFHLILYINAAATSGTVRIFVRRQIPLANNCFFDITTPGFLPDYPHLGLGNNHLYLTTNNVMTRAFYRVHRFNIYQMADCMTTSFTTFSRAPAVGQRVVVPVDGIRDMAYWAEHDSSTVFRIWTWPDTAAAPTSVTRLITAHNHNNPDCRGGANNTDWIDRSTAFSITGFRMRGSVGGGRVAWYWNVSADAAHTQAHVHSAIFNQSGLGLLAQPHIFNNGNCFGYPAVGVNERGDLGLSIAFGGRAGGATVPVRGFVAIDDEFTPGPGFFQTVFLVANGTHNPAGFPPRWGDYASVRAHEPCDLAFTATSYAHLNGTGTAQVNARYVEFLRGRDGPCYTGWRDETRIP